MFKAGFHCVLSAMLCLIYLPIYQGHDKNFRWCRGKTVHVYSHERIIAHYNYFVVAPIDKTNFDVIDSMHFHNAYILLP
jgi:hypothetical protein